MYPSPFPRSSFRLDSNELIDWMTKYSRDLPQWCILAWHSAGSSCSSLPQSLFERVRLEETAELQDAASVLIGQYSVTDFPLMPSCIVGEVNTSLAGEQRIVKRSREPCHKSVARNTLMLSRLALLLPTCRSWAAFGPKEQLKTYKSKAILDSPPRD